ncbi:hypothetical protein E5288_WYG010424 [Bos mutus]|uniref:Uncharacterized protein n=1 Tax=Bos mutus TaxID=72004 RepID=A0A6B0S7C5_9CETA|nr:hypothetical protein [Bos mutus]
MENFRESGSRFQSQTYACCSSVIASKLLVDLISDKKTISYNGCAAQFYFFCCLVNTESFLLTVTAYDRCVNAKCEQTRKDVQDMYQFMHSSNSFYVIHHFGCEYSAIISASCSDTHFSQLTCFIISTLNEDSSDPLDSGQKRFFAELHHQTRFFLAPGALLLGARPVSCASTCSLCAALCSRPTGRACSRLLAPGCGNSSSHSTDMPGVLIALLCFTADRRLLL